MGASVEDVSIPVSNHTKHFPISISKSKVDWLDARPFYGFMAHDRAHGVCSWSYGRCHRTPRVLPESTDDEDECFTHSRRMGQVAIYSEKHGFERRLYARVLCPSFIRSYISIGLKYFYSQSFTEKPPTWFDFCEKNTTKRWTTLMCSLCLRRHISLPLTLCRMQLYWQRFPRDLAKQWTLARSMLLAIPRYQCEFSWSSAASAIWPLYF